MKIVTLADIVTTAQAAANEAVNAPNTLSRQSLKLAKFAETGFDPADFDTWESAFNAQADMMAQFGRQDSPATVAAQKAAAK
jgi:hypothetical protein